MIDLKYHGKRLCYEGPVFCLPSIMFGGDEWHNDSVVISIPIVGEVTFFYNKNVDRTGWFFIAGSDANMYFLSPDYTHEAQIPLKALKEHNMPTCSNDSPDCFLPIDEVTVRKLATDISEIDLSS